MKQDNLVKQKAHLFYTSQSKEFSYLHSDHEYTISQSRSVEIHSFAQTSYRNKKSF